MKYDSVESVCFKFQLIIDGCNGPIRFREDILRRKALAAASKKDGESNKNESCAVNHRNRDDAHCGHNRVDADLENETILSLLRPESIVEVAKRKPIHKSSKTKKGTKTGRKKNQKPKPVLTTERADCVEENSNRLDMIPLLQKLLLSSKSNDEGKDPIGKELFDSIVVLFDGVSITKRPSAPLINRKERNCDVEEERIAEEIDRGRFWHVTSDCSNKTTAVSKYSSGIYNDMEQYSGRLTIEITGLYDEADNVIVERIQEHHSRRMEGGNNDSSIGSEKIVGMTNVTRDVSDFVARIRVLRRTERGAGKNRRLFQPLGLLRPESVACIFEFSAPIRTSSNADDNDQMGNNPSNTFGEEHNSRTDPAAFSRLSLDGHKTLRSIRRQNPGNVFVALDDPIQIAFNYSREDRNFGVVPIVVTDDIFLRQRIIHEGGYVMTFHQLWLLLADVV